MPKNGVPGRRALCGQTLSSRCHQLGPPMPRAHFDCVNFDRAPVPVYFGKHFLSRACLEPAGRRGKGNASLSETSIGARNARQLMPMHQKTAIYLIKSFYDRFCQTQNCKPCRGCSLLAVPVSELAHLSKTLHSCTSMLLAGRRRHSPRS